MLAPTRQPATDGQGVSPSSLFLTLNWSSWSVCSETMGESSLGDPGPGDEATRERSGRALRQTRRENKSVGEGLWTSECVCLLLSSSPQHFSEGTRWGLFTPLWVLEAPCSHFLLSFVTNQVPFSPSSPSFPPFLPHSPSSTPPSYVFSLDCQSAQFYLRLLRIKLLGTNVKKTVAAYRYSGCTCNKKKPATCL